MKLGKLFTPIIIALIIIVRFINLEQDIDFTGVSFYNELDQFEYVYPASNFSKFATQVPPAPIAQPEGRILFDLLENITTYPGFVIFGYNFLGMKIPVVIISLLSIFIFRQSIILLTKSNYFISNTLTLYLSFDFMFFITSRIQSPVGFSLFGLSIVLFFLAKSLQENTVTSSLKSVFWLGFFGLFSVLFIYIYNAFILGALGLFIGYRYLLFERSWKHIWAFTVGTLGCFLSYNIVIYLLVDKTFIDLIMALKHFGGGEDFKFIAKEGVETLSNYTKLKNTIGAFLTTNIFRFNLSFLAVFVLALGVNITQIINDKKDYIAIFSLLFFMMAFCQFFIESSYPGKKLTVILPIVLVLIGNVKDSTLTFLKGKTSISIIIGIIVSLIGYYSYSITTQDWWTGFEEGTPVWFNYLNFAMFFATISIIVISISSNYKMPKFSIVILFITNVTLINYYVVYNPRFDNKHTLLTLSRMYPSLSYICGDAANKFLYHTHFKAYLNADYGEYSHEIYEQKLDSMLTENKVDVVVFERNKKLKTQYQFEKRHNITNALERRDTLLKGENYYILVDTILPFSNREFYFGKRQQKDN